MNFGEPVSAAKNGEKWEITVPEKQLSDKGGPRDEAAKTLKEAIIILKSAREIKIVSDENKLIFNFKKKSASIPAGTELDESFNEIFSAVHNGKIRTLILDDNMRARPFTAQWLGDGKFAMSVSPVWKAAINSLSNLDLESAEIGNKFICCALRVLEPPPFQPESPNGFFRTVAICRVPPCGTRRCRGAKPRGNPSVPSEKFDLS